MKYIAHRGNVNGPKPAFENHPDYLSIALNEGYDIEVDIWYTEDGWFLGHDEPTYQIDEEFILMYSDKTWFHCKNADAIEELCNLKDIGPDSGIRFFWHQSDDFTFTSNGLIWTFPGKQLGRNSICVLPEDVDYGQNMSICYGICSDYIKKYREEV